MKTQVLHILNLGAGVQSTALYLMSLRQDEPELVPRFDYAIFADTQEEPDEVYRHLEWLKSLGGPPILVRSYGKLGDDLIRGHHQLRRKDTAKYRPGELIDQCYNIPAFLKLPDGAVSIVRRKCTEAYKINVINRAIREEIVGLDRGQRFASGRAEIVQYFGLSFDEPQRVTKSQAIARGRGWFIPRYPLFDLEMTRGDCLKYLAEVAPDRHVARSACVFCPYKQDSEWRRLRDEDPNGWARACEIDEAIRGDGAACKSDLYGVQFLHRSCVPLHKAAIDRDLPGQSLFGFTQECEGMCGV